MKSSDIDSWHAGENLETFSLSAADIRELCNTTVNVNVGYEIPNSEEEFGGLYMFDMPFEEFYLTNVLKKCGEHSMTKSEVEKVMHPNSKNATILSVNPDSEKDVETKTLQHRLAHSQEYCGKGYIFDQPVFTFCPKLIDYIPMLKFNGRNSIMNDYSKQHGDHQWPSFFVGNANIKVRLRCQQFHNTNSPWQ